MNLTIVVPVRNEVESIVRLLDSLAVQTRLPSEILLVDGGSTDGTPALIESWAAESKIGNRVRVLREAEASPGKGRNLGIAAARHDWIALTDAGIYVEPTWLEHLTAIVQRDPSTRIVFGNFEPITRSFFERCAALAYPPPKQHRPGGMMRGPSIASVLLRRDLWQAVGGFPDLRASEDLVFIERVMERGVVTAWAPKATVWWELQPSLSRTFRKFVLYSYHNVCAGRQRYWHHGVARQYVVALPFLVLAVVHHPAWAGIPFLGLLARTAKSIWTRREGRGLIWALMPLQFAGVVAIMAALDLATFVGWARALSGRKTAGQAAPSVAAS